MGQQTKPPSGHPNEPRAEQPPDPKPAASPITPERKKYLAATYGYSQEQVEVIRVQVCLSASDAELEFFLATCKRVKLDPFSRQIYFIKRRQRIEDAWGTESWVDVGRPETSIDGLRASAEQTEQYEGQAPIVWCGDDGKWVEVWLDKEPPRAARSTIYRKGLREPMVTTAMFAEFCPLYKNGKSPAMWLKMPANQIAKCAEAAGFRRAFPRDLSGLYIDAEMEHTSTDQGFVAPSVKTEGKVIDVSGAVIGQLAAPSAPKISAQIEQWKNEIASAKTRADLAPVGKICSDAKNRTDEQSVAIVKEVTPLLESTWRDLPPAKPAATRLPGPGQRGA